ncbi:hypothetical protein GQX73_g9769 [Xylaria multiplex]|uniref:FAD-binding PCMH-type domain-containing protein n=1 Tax=Xylaria multiplex TaxID=323545 RepID=A0A7C8IM23_9PEZI|nr:hypothetical protein GQX73_g9769 [Xylaria multiplex]
MVGRLRSLLTLSAIIVTASSAATPICRDVSGNGTGWPSDVVGSVVDSSDPKFSTQSARWSSYEAPTFSQVFAPEDEEQLSIGNGVLITMENFNYTKINDDLTATVGAGSTFNDVVQVVGAAGREMTVGSCPCVGATGAYLGGGVGRLQGLHGLSSDGVRKIRMALWNGTIIETTDSVNPDLFWGMRGAGQNFGFVIETTFATYPQTNGGNNYESQLTFNISSLGTVVDTVNSLLPLDPKLAIVTIVGADATTLETLVLVNLVYAGTTEEGRGYSNLFSNYSISNIETTLTYAELPTKSAGGFNNIKCIKGHRQDQYGVSMKTIDKNSFIAMAQEYTDLIQANPLLNASAFLVETFGVQAIDDLGDDYSAFPHRGRINNFLEINVSFDDDSVADAGDAWGKRWRDNFSEPDVSGYNSTVVYQNYGHGDEMLSTLYGADAWRHERLTALKQSYDPQGVFNAYHAVPRSIERWS